ncbi:MAG: hypothetical protein BWY40_00666 [bacterium ADurb.Bin270]|jgi:hypothetical protein|nr:hypothetical protein [Myxococcales bacterium]OQA61200.1 MAG: hypothetical protein BWY40_00666 [bacterium ADurb.Bin270]HQC50351.1 hypothetical protein [bacterium]HQG13694.1 hypothetical protein [bacterium]HQH80882.1 hypothetical protein [bacterium]
MKKILYIFTATALLAISTSAFASAILVDSVGGVSVKFPDEKIMAGEIGMEMPQGSFVSTDNSGRASILLETGTVAEIGPDSNYSVGRESKEVKSSEFGGGIMLAMREISASDEGPTVHGMVRGVRTFKRARPRPRANIIGAIYPKATNVLLTDKISFEWDSEPKVDWPSPAIAIDDASAKNIAIIPIKQNQSSAIVSNSSARFERGKKYSWYLATRSPELSGKTARFEFGVLPYRAEKELNSEIEKIKGLKMSPDGEAFMRAQVYYRYALYRMAVDTLQPIYKKTGQENIGKLIDLSQKKMGIRRSKD